MMSKSFYKSTEQTFQLPTHSILKIPTLGLKKNRNIVSFIFKIHTFRYPNQPVQAPPGQFHESPTDQYWNNLPTDQTGLMTTASNYPNAAQFSQNCNINSVTGDYDGTTMDLGGGWL